MLNYLVNLLINTLNEFLFKLAMLLPMGPYSQSERVLNQEPLLELESKPRDNSTREHIGEYLHADSTESFDALLVDIIVLVSYHFNRIFYWDIKNLEYKQ